MTATNLSKNKIRVLEALADRKEGLTRTQLSQLLNIQKGWAKLLGAYTKGEKSGMEGEGLVASKMIDSVKGAVYVITPHGKKMLENAAKPATDAKPETKPTGKKGKAKPVVPAKSEAEIRAEEKADAMIAEANAKAKAKREAKSAKGKGKKEAAPTTPEVVVEASATEVAVS